MTRDEKEALIQSLVNSILSKPLLASTISIHTPRRVSYIFSGEVIPVAFPKQPARRPLFREVIEFPRPSILQPYKA